MTGWRLFRWVLVRGVLSGAVLGAVFLYIGLLWGTVLGAIFGTVNGIALVLLTYICFSPMRDYRRYRWYAVLIAAASTIATSFLWASVVNASADVTTALTLVATLSSILLTWGLPDGTAPQPSLGHQPFANRVLSYSKK